MAVTVLPCRELCRCCPGQICIRDRLYRVLEMGEGEYIRVKDAKMSIRLIDAILESGKSGSYKSIL